jgi:hypothetical protein
VLSFNEVTIISLIFIMKLSIRNLGAAPLILHDSLSKWSVDIPIEEVYELDKEDKQLILHSPTAEGSGPVNVLIANNSSVEITIDAGVQFTAVLKPETTSPYLSLGALELTAGEEIIEAAPV